jgi:cell division septation protein DedD
MPGPSFGDQVYAQPHGGALEQAYAEEDVYEADERPRRGRGLKIVAVLAGAIMVGGGLAYSYSALLGPSSDANTPVVKSADGPFKVKPSEPGGKQFAHSDSKIMGRLGEGATGAGAATAATEASSAEAASATDPVTGARKVPILVVGRDGSIQPPAATDTADQPRAAATTATVSVPGMTIIDGLGGAPAAKPAAPKVIAAAEPEKPVVVNPPSATQKKSEPAAAAPAGAARPQSSSDSSDTVAAVASEKKPAAKKATSTAAAASSPAPTGAGFVAVLASVPASSNSRINALQKFADMQQKYGSLLQDKTPDVQEANLGDKGTYHRLLVGPPGSRDSANSLCTQLKAQGYSDCWVTAY